MCALQATGVGWFGSILFLEEGDIEDRMLDSCHGLDHFLDMAVWRVER